jgi:hypothetical protein
LLFNTYADETLVRALLISSPKETLLLAYLFPSLRRGSRSMSVRLAPRTIGIALAATLLLPGCSRSEDDVKKYLVGTWECAPRVDLKDRVQNYPNVTPDRIDLKLGADGKYTYVRHEPASPDDPVALPERYREWKGNWDLSRTGALCAGECKGAPLKLFPTEKWGATHEPPDGAPTGPPSGERGSPGICRGSTNGC